MAQKHREAPDTGPREIKPVAPSTTSSLARATHRERQVRRLAVVAMVRAAYGLQADARLVPPGPECCPVGCPYCGPRRWAA